MNYKLRATANSGSAAIVTALAGVNLSALAAKLGMRKPARLQELAYSENPKPVSADELTNLCAVMSDGLLRYVAETDVIVRDAVNSVRAGLIGRDLSTLGKDASVALHLLDRFVGGEDCLTTEQLDELVLHIFPGLEIDHETSTLVPRGYIKTPDSDFEHNRNPHLRILNPEAPLAVDPSLKSHAVPVHIGVFPPVAQGSSIPKTSILTLEPRRAGYDRLMAKYRTIPYMI